VIKEQLQEIHVIVNSMNTKVRRKLLNYSICFKEIITRGATYLLFYVIIQEVQCVLLTPVPLS
jgi:hypothetical protein